MLVVQHFSEKEGDPWEVKRVAMRTKQNDKNWESRNSVVVSRLLVIS